MCLVGTGSSGIASGHVSPALGERELMTHQFCSLSPGKTLNAAWFLWVTHRVFWVFVVLGGQ